MGAQTYAHGRRGLMLAATAAAALGAGSAAHAQSEAAGAAPEPTAQLEEVVVTASRREETIRATPIALSAYGGAQLEQAHVQSLPDLVTQSPNIQLGTNGANTNIAVRGIGTNLQTAGNDPGVAFHLDGVYVPDTALALLTFMDVSRVEVLRGPQGTLFGRNATGGAVNIISNMPTTSPVFGFDASVGLPLGEHVAAYASGPLDGDGKLLGRVSVQQTYQRGTVDNRASRGPSRFGDQNNYAGRAQLEWRPTESLRARLLTDYQRSDTAGPAYYLIGTPNAALGLPIELAGTPIARKGDDIAATYGAAKLLEKGATLFLEGDVGEGSVRATISRRRTEVYSSNDGDGTVVDFSSTIFDQSRNATYGEVLYSSNDKRRFSWIVGANYFDDDQVQAIAVSVIRLPFPVAITGDVSTRSYAAFGHAQFRLTEDWKLFGGARYSRDRKRLDETNNFAGARSQSDRWSKPTFEIGTSYDLSPTSTGYLKYATGYKSGGYSAGALAPAFAPETSRMWEAGLKGSYFDGALEANVAVFHTAYRNLQVNQIIGFLAQVTNAAQATIDGAEVELVQHLTPDLRIDLSGGWLDARFDGFKTQDSARPQLGVLELKGNRLPQAPKVTIGGGPVYSRELADGGRLTAALRYDWKSRTYFSEFNLPLVSQPAAGRLSGYVNYDLPGGVFQVGVYGRNLTDERTLGSKVVGSAGINSITMGTLGPRREFGVSLHGRF